MGSLHQGRPLTLEEVVAELVERLWRQQRHLNGSEIPDHLMMRAAELAREARGDDDS